MFVFLNVPQRGPLQRVDVPQQNNAAEHEGETNQAKACLSNGFPQGTADAVHN